MRFILRLSLIPSISNLPGPIVFRQWSGMQTFAKECEKKIVKIARARSMKIYMRIENRNKNIYSGIWRNPSGHLPHFPISFDGLLIDSRAFRESFSRWTLSQNKKNHPVHLTMNSLW